MTADESLSYHQELSANFPNHCLTFPQAEYTEAESCSGLVIRDCRSEGATRVSFQVRTRPMLEMLEKIQNQKHLSTKNLIKIALTLMKWVRISPTESCS